MENYGELRKQVVQQLASRYHCVAGARQRASLFHFQQQGKNTPATAAYCGLPQRTMRCMRILPRFRSMLGLILAGFGVVALPLVAAVMLAVINAERLERQSTVLVEQAVTVARLSESLTEQLTDMERNARQYQVLGAPALLEAYLQRQQQFTQVLERLARLPLPQDGGDRIEALRQGSHRIGNALSEYAPQSEALGKALQSFERLRELALGLNAAGVAFVDEALGNLRSSATEARQNLVLTAMLVFPAVFVLALVFTFLINRPVRQLERAIGRLGEESFDEPINVRGPAELRALGEQLEWLRQRMDALETDKARFLRHMSHELKTPLASLREGAELLLDGSTGAINPTQREVAALLRINSLELQQMILNLLDFSSWQERTHHLNKSEVDLKALAQSVAKRHQLTLTGRDIRLHVSGNRVSLQADRDKLRIALDNLITNAVKFSPPGGLIQITVGNSSGYATLDVSDQGPGIDESDRERIFEPFYQGASTQAGPVRGTGIGLSVVRECINAHGGTIVVEDAKEGAHIHVKLPLAA